MAIKLLLSLKPFPQNNSEENIGHYREIPTKRYVYPEERQQIINDLRLIMEYQKIINLTDNTQYEPSKFRTRNWVEINDESRRTYSKLYSVIKLVSNQIKFKTSMISQTFVIIVIHNIC